MVGKLAHSPPLLIWNMILISRRVPWRAVSRRAGLHPLFPCSGWQQWRQQVHIFIPSSGGHRHCLVPHIDCRASPLWLIVSWCDSAAAPALRRRPLALQLFSDEVQRRRETKQSVKAAKCQRHYRQLDKSQSLFKERTEAASGSLNSPATA